MIIVIKQVAIYDIDGSTPEVALLRWWEYHFGKADNLVMHKRKLNVEIQET